jgi:hypothetical protein
VALWLVAAVEVLPLLVAVVAHPVTASAMIASPAVSRRISPPACCFQVCQGLDAEKPPPVPPFCLSGRGTDCSLCLPHWVGAVHSTGAFRVGQVKHGRAMLVLDHQKRTVPRASGLCETYGEVAAFMHEKRRSRSSGLLPAWLSRCGKHEVFPMTPEIPAAVAWNLFRFGGAANSASGIVRMIAPR